MKSLLIFAIGLAMASMCNKEKAANRAAFNIPACIQNKIDEIKRQPKWSQPAEVHEYLFNGKKVYLFSADCCDQFYTLEDSACNYLCAPSGGIAGHGDRKCPDFNDKAQLLRLVWRDSR